VPRHACAGMATEPSLWNRKRVALALPVFSGREESILLYAWTNPSQAPRQVRVGRNSRPGRTRTMASCASPQPRRGTAGATSCAKLRRSGFTDGSTRSWYGTRTEVCSSLRGGGEPEPIGVRKGAWHASQPEAAPRLALAAFAKLWALLAASADAPDDTRDSSVRFRKVNLNGLRVPDELLVGGQHGVHVPAVSSNRGDGDRLCSRGCPTCVGQRFVSNYVAMPAGY
jgi:hypothetical protein